MSEQKPPAPIGILLNYPQTIFYPADTYSELDMIRLEWPDTNRVIDVYAVDVVDSDGGPLQALIDDLRAEAWDDRKNNAYEWALRKGLDMSPEEEEMLTPDDWAALRDIIRAAVDRHQMTAGQRELFDGGVQS
jgi:hypothetical protein